ncbi:MAG: ATP-binding protein, partial [Alphaproteobacteria bacterium]
APSEEPGEVRISSVRRDGMAVAEVAHNGPGLATRVRDHLFQFFAGSARSGGSGLGLPIAREIMRAHGGEISIAKFDDSGTVIRLELPDE